MNPYQVYKQASVTTASPKSIVVQLHDKAIMELDIAYEAWKKGNIEEMRPHVTHVQDIISYLHTSLTPNIEISETMARLYNYYLLQLSNIFTDPTDELFGEAKQYLLDWRETWREA